MEKFGIIFLSLFFCSLLAAGYGDVTVVITPRDCTSEAGYLSGVNLTVTSLIPVSLTGNEPYVLYSGLPYTINFLFTQLNSSNAIEYPNGLFTLTGVQQVLYPSFLGKVLQAAFSLPNQVALPLINETTSTLLQVNTQTTVSITFVLPAGTGAFIKSTTVPGLISLLSNPHLGLNRILQIYQPGQLTLSGSFLDLFGSLGWCKQGLVSILDTLPVSATTLTP